MTWIPDLTCCDALGLPHEGHLLAVGWLDGEHEFPVGPIGEEDYRHLQYLLTVPFQWFMVMGVHECELCQFDGDAGSANLFVPDAGDILVAPELILHYIACHHYRPPERFLTAARRLANSRGMAYLTALLKNNGRFLIPGRE